MDDDDFDYLLSSRRGHFIWCETCWKSWSIDDLPETCRMTGCDFPEVSRQVRDDLERLREMRDDYASSLGLSIE